MTTYPLDPELAAVVPMLPRADCSDLEGARTEMEAGIQAALEGVDATGVDVFEVVAPGPEGAPDVVLRGYRPQGVEGPLPVVYDIHGGGFILGNVDFDHGTNVALARELGAAVFSVEYRLAPEHPYPAGVEDAYAGLVHLAKNAAELGIDPARTALLGFSAGAGIAAGLALLARDRGGPAIVFQYLGIPEVDDRLDTPSMRAFTDTPVWNRPNAVISWDHYLGPGMPGSADVPLYAAPARATAEQLAGLPPAYISVMEFDPLRDEGIDYARALLAAGVGVELHLFPGTFHGSGLVEHAEVSRRDAAEAVTVLRKALR
ncbi:alpha/beta hydrolase [Streptomyces aurantiacus]|uniref:Esterase n=1 Tax=Streptomyces aurantiacus TaxID=47760 RepID=A0A7G1P9D6_9ACTN|nr:alpha/beta hydrolase [Streptomyces aurantiacus]BCL30337.1 esterase [Streptomyces aurantiacus]